MALFRRLLSWRSVPIFPSSLSYRLMSSYYYHPSNLATVPDRIEIVDSVSRTQELVQKFLSDGMPVAVDMEGFKVKVPGLVQVRDWDGGIFLFRTGRKSEILTGKHQLKALFQSHQIVKIFHNPEADCQALTDLGIRAWNIYSTGSAHQVIQFARFGKSIHGQTKIQLGDICEYYGLDTNPKQGDPVYLHQNKYIFSEPELDPDLVLYTAHDVECLHDLYDITSALIDDSYVPLLRRMEEDLIINCFNKRLSVYNSNSLAKLHFSSILITNLPLNCNPTGLYLALKKFPFNYRIMFSNLFKTAHVLVDNRENTIRMFCALNEDKDLIKRDLPGASFRLNEPLTTEEKAVKPKELSAVNLIELERSHQRVRGVQHDYEGQSAGGLGRPKGRRKSPLLHRHLRGPRPQVLAPFRQKPRHRQGLWRALCL